MSERQATVRSFDAGARGGTLVGDDGVVLPFDGGALDPAVLLLRPGQRVRVRLEGDGVVALTLVGLPLVGLPST